METIIKTRRQPAEWEKIFANHLSDKELISKTYKKYLKHIKIHTAQQQKTS